MESGGDSNAVGKANDVGVLQITSIIVEECNRILGDSVYSLEDRYDKQKSIEMFNIVQKHHNPKRNIHLALKIWNSKANLEYHKKVENKYNEICRKEN